MNQVIKLATLLLLVCMASGLHAAEDKNKPERPSAPDSPEATQFGYPNIDEALAALKARPGVVISQQGGWTIAEDKPNYTIWSFTPPGHPAHPSAIKRVIVLGANGDISITMTGKCGASVTECDKLTSEFRALNARMRESMKAAKPKTP